MPARQRSPIPVLAGAFAAILLVLGLMVVASALAGRALVSRYETEVRLAELAFEADRLQTRVSEQANTYQDFLRTPAPIRLQLYRAAHQAVFDQLVSMRQAAPVRAELTAALDNIAAVGTRWDAELGESARLSAGPPSPEAAAELSGRADALAGEYGDAIRAYQEQLDNVRTANRETGQAAVDQFQLVVRLGGLIGGLLVVGVGLVTALTIRRSVEELAASRRAIVHAQETVRRDVAERLHGEVQGKLLALELQLRQAADTIPRDPAGAVAEVRSVVGRLEAVRETTRAVSHQLHPAILRMGLPAALRSLRDSLEPAVTVELDVAPEVEARELRRSFGVAADHAPPPLPEDVRLALYRLVQEGVNNAVHHGGVAEVAVRLWSPRPDQLAVSVEDHGQGFGRARPTGLGLASLRGAMEALGGRLEVASGPASGTRVLAVVPLNGQE
ncbi:MAG TPA: ATP-binding protein [Chloroflexota bacterium]|nr:ATP-binding protein [Chloroflexota bacterium]